MQHGKEFPKYLEKTNCVCVCVRVRVCGWVVGGVCIAINAKLGSENQIIIDFMKKASALAKLVKKNSLIQQNQHTVELISALNKCI